eukprot:2365980-Amphidinium_carterae.1
MTNAEVSKGMCCRSIHGFKYATRLTLRPSPKSCLCNHPMFELTTYAQTKIRRGDLSLQECIRLERILSGSTTVVLEANSMPPELIEPPAQDMGTVQGT